MLSNVIAWIIAVLFAFITNKVYVFESKNITMRVIVNELLKFTGARLATGVLDSIIMFVSVDLLYGPALVTKVVSNIIVIILNYILANLFVFKK